MKKVLCFVLATISIGAYSQMCGIYTGMIESKTKYIKSQALELNQNNSYELKVENLSLEFEIPQHTISIEKGKYVENDEGVVLISDSIETQIVNYKEQSQKDDKQYIGSRRGSYIPVDTSVLEKIPKSGKNLFYKYERPNSIFLCHVESSIMFSKLLKTEKSNELTFHTEEILTNHRIQSIVNSYERKYRTSLNYSDSILIDNQLDTISKSCSKFIDIVHSKKYSGEYIKMIVRELIKLEVCPLEIFDINYYYFPHENSLRPWELMNYPIKVLLNDNEIIRYKLFSSMQRNQVICNSDFLKNIPNNIELEFMANLLSEYKEYILKTKVSDLTECEKEVISNLKVRE